MGSSNTYQFPFAKYPAIRIAVLLAAGIITAYQLDLSSSFPILFTFGGACCLFFLFESILHKKFSSDYYRLSITCYLMIIFIFGMAWYTLTSNYKKRAARKPLNLYTWEEIKFKGTIYEVKPTSTGKYLIDVSIDSTVITDSLLWENSYNVRAIFDPSKTPLREMAELGSRIFFRATIYPLDKRRNPHEFDYKAYLSSKNIFTQAGIDTIYSITPPQNGFSWYIFRQKVLNCIDSNFSPNVRSLAKALLIGYKNELGRDEKKAFSRVGLSHIMAVSGLHVGFIIAPFWLLIPWFWTLKYGKQIGLLFLVLLLTGYAGLTGFSASVSRAALTGGFITYGKLFHKVRDSMNLTAVSAIILLLVNPEDLFNPGFQLSFAAVYIILLTVPVFSRWLPVWIRFRWYGTPVMVIIVSVVVQIGLFPLLSYHFGEFSLIGPAANALAVPLLGFVVPYALFLLPVSTLLPDLTIYLNFPNDRFLAALNVFVQWGSQLEWSWIQVHTESPALFISWMVAIFVIATLRIPELRWKLLAILMFLLVWQTGNRFIKRLTPFQLKVTIFDVGQGDAILVHTPANKHFLIDTGRWSPGYNSGRDILLPHLKAEGINHLNGVFLSHPHADHIGGIVELLNEITVETVYNSGYHYDSNLYRTYLNIARKKSIPVKKLAAGTIMKLDQNVQIWIYGPQETDFGPDPNEHSLVFELTYGSTEFLFMGDAGKEQEERVIKIYDHLLETDFLKVGHHGSRTSSSVPFLSRASPEIAVVSLAKSNRYRHPHPEAVERLKRYCNKVYFTSLDKALIFASDGRNIERIDW